MNDADFKAQLKQQLPGLLRQDAEIRALVLQTVEHYLANRQETESRFDRVLAELQRDREEQARKWDENARRQDETLEAIKAMNRKHDSTIGALGSRWGLYTETAFRKALKGILSDSFGVEVVNVVEYDDAGEVFGRPDQIELDILIKNGDLIICEIKSSVSKPDLYAFARKIDFYEKRHQRQATRKIVISPMVHPSAQPLGPRLGIEMYSYADDVPPIPEHLA